MTRKATTVFCLLSALAFSDVAEARDQIRIVGSSTVFPFSAVVAESFGRVTNFKTPVVESTGTGGGMKLFCAGVGKQHPDVTNASRRIKVSEFQACAKNGVTMTELKIGFDGIVLANSWDATPLKLTLAQIFLSLAKQVPVDGKLVANPHHRWSDIDPNLPNMKIEVLGPPPTSGTRDAFVEIAMEGGCAALASAKALGLSKSACHVIREDGAFIEVGENDNLIVQKLEANSDAVGIFGFSFLDQNFDRVRGAVVEGIEPEFENIATSSYPIARSLYVYVKKEHVDLVAGLRDFVGEFTNEGTWGPEGYLVDKGLIPLPDGERQRVRDAVRDLAPLLM